MDKSFLLYTSVNCLGCWLALLLVVFNFFLFCCLNLYEKLFLLFQYIIPCAVWSFFFFFCKFYIYPLFIFWVLFCVVLFITKNYTLLDLCSSIFKFFLLQIHLLITCYFFFLLNIALYLSLLLSFVYTNPAVAFPLNAVMFIVLVVLPEPEGKDMLLHLLLIMIALSWGPLWAFYLCLNCNILEKLISVNDGER